MTDIITILLSIVVIYFIMKLVGKVLKVLLTISVIIIAIYIIMNFGQLSGIF